MPPVAPDVADQVGRRLQVLCVEMLEGKACAGMHKVHKHLCRHASSTQAYTSA
jgi:hypothetical protein